jgi:hypothetical protein
MNEFRWNSLSCVVSFFFTSSRQRSSRKIKINGLPAGRIVVLPSLSSAVGMDGIYIDRGGRGQRSVEDWK